MIIEDLFFEILQVAVGYRRSLSKLLSEDEWNELFLMCEKQALTAFVFTALNKVSSTGQKPSQELLFQWIGISEEVKYQNKKMDETAARLTSFFDNAGLSSMILKGQANAILYPNPFCRQPGDIDIYVEGGRRNLLNLFFNSGVLNKDFYTETPPSNHHIHLPTDKNGVEIEVHYCLSSGNHHPITNRRLQKILKAEYMKGTELIDKGFRIPSLRFSLIMQLSHIQSHAISSGIGLRQIIDYYYLLKAGSESLKENPVDFNKLGLRNIAGALMWILKEKMGMEDKYLIVSIDSSRGKMLLDIVMKGGNFGHYTYNRTDNMGFWQAVRKHVNRLSLMRINASEVMWQEFDFAVFFFKTLPERIRNRRFSLVWSEYVIS